MFGPKADIVDVFSTIQGEGIFLGARQIFIRFKKCNMSCAYCDEPEDSVAKEYSPLELMSEVKYIDLSSGPHHSVSLTGGEPLLYAEFLKIFLRSLKKQGYKAYLETNGTLPDEFSKVADMVDIVAMDFKLPSSTGERPYWKEHLEFLKISTKNKIFVKAVVTPDTAKEDIKKAIDLIKKVDRSIPFILQPATPVKAKDRQVDKGVLMRFVEIGSRNKLNNIRVIPQIHKILNVK